MKKIVIVENKSGKIYSRWYKVTKKRPIVFGDIIMDDSSYIYLIGKNLQKIGLTNWLEVDDKLELIKDQYKRDNNINKIIK